MRVESRRIKVPKTGCALEFLKPGKVISICAVPVSAKDRQLVPARIGGVIHLVSRISVAFDEISEIGCVVHCFGRRGGKRACEVFIEVRQA